MYVPAIKRSISSMSHKPSDEAHSIMRSTGVVVTVGVVAAPWKRGCKYSSRPTIKAVVDNEVDVGWTTKDVAVLGRKSKSVKVERMIVARNIFCQSEKWILSR